MIISVKFDTSQDLFGNVSSNQHWSVVNQNENEDCWSIWKPEDVPLEPQYDAAYLTRMHILTVCIVGFLGAFLILLLFCVVLLSNETVAELVCRKKNLVVKKGLDGYFPFYHDTADSVSTPELASNGKDHIEPTEPSMTLLQPLKADLSLLDTGLIIPLHELPPTIHINTPSFDERDDVSMNSIIDPADTDTETPRSPKKVYFIDEKF